MRTETVLTICHVQAGKEKAFEDVLARTWAIYQREHLVEAQPHVLVQGTELDGKPFFAEVFTWVSHRAPDQRASLGTGRVGRRCNRFAKPGRAVPALISAKSSIIRAEAVAAIS